MKPTVLVVDDDWAIRELLLNALADEFDVLEASDGIFALSEVIGKQRIDLIITDLKMPELDGVDFIKNLPADIPFIIISAYVESDSSREELEHFYPAAVFGKPFKVAEVRGAVREALKKR